MAPVHLLNGGSAGTEPTKNNCKARRVAWVRLLFLEPRHNDTLGTLGFAGFRHPMVKSNHFQSSAVSNIYQVLIAHGFNWFSAPYLYELGRERFNGFCSNYETTKTQRRS